MMAGEMVHNRVGSFKVASDYYNFAIEWQMVTGQILSAFEETHEAGQAKIEDAKARAEWLRKRKVEDSARAKSRKGGKRVDTDSACESDRDIPSEPVLFGNRRCISRRDDAGKDKSNAWIWNGEIFTKRFL